MEGPMSSVDTTLWQMSVFTSEDLYKDAWMSGILIETEGKYAGEIHLCIYDTYGNLLKEVLLGHVTFNSEENVTHAMAEDAMFKVQLKLKDEVIGTENLTRMIDHLMAFI